MKKCRNVFDPIPEVYTRLAAIRTEEGKTKEAVELYLAAKKCLAQRIGINAFFGNLNIMKWLVNDLYRLVPFDPEYFDLFDLYYLFREPHKIRFCLGKETFIAESVEENGECVISFNGKWFRGTDDFFQKACISGRKLTAEYRNLYGFEVLQ